MQIDDTLKEEIVARVLSVARPARIILFGSAAAGSMTRDSDIDLHVVEVAPGLSSAAFTVVGDTLQYSWRDRYFLETKECENASLDGARSPRETRALPQHRQAKAWGRAHGPAVQPV